METTRAGTTRSEEAAVLAAVQRGDASAFATLAERFRVARARA